MPLTDFFSAKQLAVKIMIVLYFATFLAYETFNN